MNHVLPVILFELTMSDLYRILELRVVALNPSPSPPSRSEGDRIEGFLREIVSRMTRPEPKNRLSIDDVLSSIHQVTTLPYIQPFIIAGSAGSQRSPTHLEHNRRHNVVYQITDCIPTLNYNSKSTLEFHTVTVQSPLTGLRFSQSESPS